MNVNETPALPRRIDGKRKSQIKSRNESNAFKTKTSKRRTNLIRLSTTQTKQIDAKLHCQFVFFAFCMCPATRTVQTLLKNS